MRKFRLITFVMILSLTLLACAILSAGPETTVAPVTETVIMPAETESAAYPYPEPYLSPAIESLDGVYPYPMAQYGPLILYPELKDGDSLDWEQAVGALFSMQVTKVMQTHDLKVYITFKDGRTLVTVEPAIDEILKYIESCGDLCKDIKVATE